MPFDTLEDVVVAARAFDGVCIERRSYLLKDYPACFVASEFVTWLSSVGLQMPRADAVQIGQSLIDLGVMRHGTVYCLSFYSFVYVCVCVCVCVCVAVRLWLAKANMFSLNSFASGRS